MREGRGGLLLSIHRLKHQQRPPKVPITLLCNPLGQGLFPLQLLRTSHILHNLHHLVYTRRRNPHQQRPAADRRNNPRRGIRNQNQPEVRRVLFHGPPKRGLGVAGEGVGLIDDHDLEALLCREVHLLRLRNLLEQVLYHDAVAIAHVAGRDLEVVDGRDDGELGLAVADRVGAAVDLDLFDAGPVELLERCDDAGLLAGA